MNLDELINQYSESDSFRGMVGKLTPRVKLRLIGLVGSVDSVLAATLFRHNNTTQLFVFNDADDARYFYSDLENLLEGKTVLFFPPSYKRSFQTDSVDNSLVLERAEVLNKLNQHSVNGELIVTTADALAELVISEKSLTKNTYELKVGSTFDLEFFIDFLTEHHFDRSDFVYEAGQFSIRGGIVDVFSFSNDQPYRIELNGDEIESIRTFDPASQLSVKRVDKFFIIPNVQKEIENTTRQHFFNYLKDDAIIWSKDLQLSNEIIEKGVEKATLLYKKLQHSNDGNNLTEPDKVYVSAASVIAEIKKYRVIEFGTRFYFKNHEAINFNISPQPVFHKNFKLLIEDLKSNQQKKLTNLIFSDSSRQIERLYSIFDDLDKSVEFQPVYHAITSGFIDHDLEIACYTEHQIFDRFYRGKIKQGYTKSKIITLKELRDLKPGDYVTHIDHGIGKFAGLEKVEVNGNMQEAVRLVYREGDLLYVSINSLHKISKYVGKEGTEPRVNKLGSDAWEKLKTNTKKKVKDIARDLIKLYAKRKAQSGFAFTPDSYLQTELEASFMYEDTPDQTKATADFKKDMESSQPMDRLICGDVGFGKTEIAIRAAFKAVCDSKQ